MESEQRKESLRAAADDFWDMISLNMLFIFACLPVITYGAAAGALYSAVSRLEEKKERGGAVAMYWALLKRNLRRGVQLWLAVLAAVLLALVDLSIIGQMPVIARYCSYGLQCFVLILLQITVTVGFPVISESGMSVVEAVKKSFAVLAESPFRTLLSCVVQAAPLGAAVFAPKAFAWLFLLWITVYFSFAEKWIAAMLGQAICRKIT